ncbi:MAG: 50S ribosomal protein L4 [Rickettsiales bacterium]|nr:50S ribosomal protein L4 [Rickettsiales bacterium]
MKAEIYKIENLDSKTEASIILDDSVFAIDPNHNAIQTVINWQLAKRRSGNHKVKNVSEVRGTTAKPFKQKGTGRARQGSLRSVQMRGGGVIFGPVLRSHGYKVNKKVRKLALKSALSFLVKEGRIQIVENPKFSSPKTSILKKSIKDKQKYLFVVDDETCKNFELSLGNLRDVNTINVNGVNVYDLINSSKVIFCESTINKINEKLS